MLSVESAKRGGIGVQRSGTPLTPNRKPDGLFCQVFHQTRAEHSLYCALRSGACDSVLLPAMDSPALLKVATHVYRFPLPATKVIAFTKCFSSNVGAEETSKTIRCGTVDIILRVVALAPGVLSRVPYACTTCPCACHVMNARRDEQGV